MKHLRPTQPVDKADILVLQAWLAHAHGKPDMALRFLSAAVRIVQDHTYAHYAIGSTLAEDEDSQAEEHLLQAAKCIIYASDAFLILSSLSEKRGDNQAAERWYSASVEAADRHAAIARELWNLTRRFSMRPAQLKMLERLSWEDALARIPGAQAAYAVEVESRKHRGHREKAVLIHLPIPFWQQLNLERREERALEGIANVYTMYGPLSPRHVSVLKKLRKIGMEPFWTRPAESIKNPRPVARRRPPLGSVPGRGCGG